jgi:hypothetical protein
LGILADFFVAGPAEALRYANRMEEPDEGEEIQGMLNPVEYKGITSLELGTLWAILEATEWDVKKHMPEDVFLGEEGESWLTRFPVELTTLLADAGDDDLAKASVRWAKTEELDCAPEDLRPLLDDLRSLALHAVSNGKSIYLWGSL